MPIQARRTLCAMLLTMLAYVIISTSYARQHQERGID